MVDKQTLSDADAFLAILHAEQAYQLNLMRQLPEDTETGPFFGTRFYTKNNSVVIARCELCPDGNIDREINLENVDVLDITRLKNKESFASRRLSCTEENMEQFLFVLELSGFARRIRRNVRVF